jgi:Tfp pilus assembly protein PilX
MKWEGEMRSTRFRNQNGIVLVVILLTLTLLGIIGLSFVFYASERACLQNPTIEIKDERCVKNIGPDRR